MMALRFDGLAICFGLGVALLSGCAETLPTQNSPYADSTAPTSDFKVANGLSKLEYFSAPPNGSYSLDNLILGPDQNLWYSNAPTGSNGSTYTISKFSPSTKTTVSYPVPPACEACGAIEPTSLVAGPDGRIWFGAARSTVIGAMETSGNVKYYAGPYPCSEAYCDVVLGAIIGQNIWFTAESLSAAFRHQLLVGYIDTSTGATKTYATGVEHVPPSQITLGPDGRLWFGAGRQVANISTYGGVNLFYTHPPMTVRSIVSGPDSELWFVGDMPAVGRIKTDGRTLNEIPLKRGEIPFQLIATPKGQVWLTTPHAIVRMISPKRFSTMAVPRRLRDCEPVGITVASDGNVWFSSTSDGQVCSRGIGTVLLGMKSADASR